MKKPSSSVQSGHITHVYKRRAKEIESLLQFDRSDAKITAPNCARKTTTLQGWTAGDVERAPAVNGLRIRPLQEVPNAARFCSWYIETWWEERRITAAEIVYACLTSSDLPFILVATQNGAFAGCVMGCARSDDVCDKFSPWIALLYVRPSLRKKTIGMALVHAACSRLRELGYQRVYADTTTAQGFFVKLGWRFVEAAKWRDETTDIFMADLPSTKVA